MSAPTRDITATATATAVLAGSAAVSAARSLAEVRGAAEQALLGGSRLGPAEALRWWSEVTRRRRPRWASPHEVVFSTPIARLRDFSGDRSAGSDDDVVPTLVLPPQAGHDSCIVDFSPAQSQVETIRAAGLTRTYSLDWVSATPATRGTTVEDYVEVIDRAIDVAGGPVNLVGDCQGGWLGAIYAALRPERIHTLTLAGAPIDFHAGNAMIAASTQLLSGMFGSAPYHLLVAAGAGNMPGRFALGNFIGIQPDAEVARQLQLLLHLDDDEHLERYHAFEDWFKHTQDIPGTFYLWLVEHLFRRNELVRGELRVAGQRLDLADITCPLFLLAGATDHITPPPQLFAAADAVGTPAADITKRTTTGGHLGLFMGREALRDHWPPLMSAVHELSVPGRTDRAASRRRSTRATPAGTAPELPAY